MILSNAPVNEAVLSNVGEIGEFRIRNSAKAFSILSSGLYANKVRAIVRELSCNATDSHVAAGRAEVPFDVHLPNSLEPHFSIRDYGTGLSHDQVTQIYTTYFESTKTNSNEFIGALGLGSKSPFSYTDNFTVTAIKDGKKGIYSAFINGDGVPSIALMMQEETDEQSGVEVKFSVNERWDFDKFYQEARNVYTYFAVRPNVSGYSDFKFIDIAYDSRDIIPGAHSIKGGYASIAVMGNIAYPIQIPQSDKSLDAVRSMLNCGLELHFNIGELDFQASREGLSYIPQTIASIKEKLEAVNAELTNHIKTEADLIPNLWERAEFLNVKKNSSLWSAAVVKYAQDSKLTTFNFNGTYSRMSQWKMSFSDLASKFNIILRGIRRERTSKTISSLRSDSDYVVVAGKQELVNYWTLPVDTAAHFIINDTKTGATERAKYHYRETQCTVSHRTVYVIEPSDRSKDVDTAGFFASICNPPEDQIFKASDLLQKARSSASLRAATILSLKERGSSWGNSRSRDSDMVWRDAGTLDTFDNTVTYFYVPLSGFSMQSTKGYTNGKDLFDDACSVPGLFNGDIYGVRKADIDLIKSQKNWVNLEDHISKVLNAKNNDVLLMSLVKSKIQTHDVLGHDHDHNLDIVIPQIKDQSSLFVTFANTFKDVKKFTGNEYNVSRVFRYFAPNTNLSPDAMTIKYKTMIDDIFKNYPLLTYLRGRHLSAQHLIEYINMCDENRNVKS